MKLSIHTDIIGKPDKIEKPGQKPYYVCKGKIINQGYGWQNIDVDTWEEAFELITTDGYATSSELLADHRTDDNFVSRQICMVDIDNGMTLFELFDNDFYNKYGAGFYTTARHTNDAHRFRILFVLEEPETDCVRMRKIIRGLLETFEASDKSCKDASRIYYGIPNCEIKECTTNILTTSKIQELINIIDEIDSVMQKVTQHTYDYSNITKYDEVFVDSLLKRIRDKVGTLQGEYDTYKTIAWAVCHTLGQHNAQAMMSRYWATKTQKEPQVIKTYNHNKSPTIGTLIKMSGIDKDMLRQLDNDFKHRNNIQVVLTPGQALKELRKKIRIY
jgi:hypothetical protein